MTRAERHELEQEARQIIPSFRFWDIEGPGQVSPVSQRAVSFPVYYLDPIEGNERALGFDPVNHPIRSDGIERAVESGHLSVSAPTPLVQGDPSRLAFLVFVPVYQGRVVAPSGESLFPPANQPASPFASPSGTVRPVRGRSSKVTEIMNGLVSDSKKAFYEDRTELASFVLLYRAAKETIRWPSHIHPAPTTSSP